MVCSIAMVSIHPYKNLLSQEPIKNVYQTHKWNSAHNKE